ALVGRVGRARVGCNSVDGLCVEGASCLLHRGGWPFRAAGGEPEDPSDTRLPPQRASRAQFAQPIFLLLTRTSSIHISDSVGMGWYSQRPNQTVSNFGGRWFGCWPAAAMAELLRRSVSSVSLTHTCRTSVVGSLPFSKSSMQIH